MNKHDIEWGNWTGRVIHRGLLWDFPVGFYNGVFQFMSKIKPVVNTTWYFYVLFYNVNYTHLYTPNTNSEAAMFVFENVCLYKNVLDVHVCSLHCWTKRKSIVKLRLPHTLKNSIIKPHRKISKESAANYSFGFWRHNPPTPPPPISLYGDMLFKSLKGSFTQKFNLSNCHCYLTFKSFQTCMHLFPLHNMN